MTTLHHRVKTGDPQLGLLLVHALGGDLTMWDDFIAAWDRPETIIACDLRNAGQSLRSTTPLRPFDHCADLDDLRRACGVQKVVPVGCAIGAMIVAAYAAHFPEATAGLVLTNPTMRTIPSARTMLAERAEAVRKSGMQAIMPGATERAFNTLPHDIRYRNWVDHFVAQDPTAYALSIEGILDADVSADMRQIQCPTLIVAGHNDILLPPALAQEIHAIIPSSRYVCDEKSAHFIPYQNPQGLSQLIAEFIARDVAQPHKGRP